MNNLLNKEMVRSNFFPSIVHFLSGLYHKLEISTALPIWKDIELQKVKDIYFISDIRKDFLNNTNLIPSYKAEG